jgi:hypothetical protein
MAAQFLLFDAKAASPSTLALASAPVSASIWFRLGFGGTPSTGSKEISNPFGPRRQQRPRLADGTQVCKNQSERGFDHRTSTFGSYIS